MGEPMEQYGNKSNFNIEGVLATNINNSVRSRRGNHLATRSNRPLRATINPGFKLGFFVDGSLSLPWVTITQLREGTT
jgi:hypothetical protein